jgi:hypothetical protein
VGVKVTCRQRVYDAYENIEDDTIDGFILVKMIHFSKINGNSVQIEHLMTM